MLLRARGALVRRDRSNPIRNHIDGVLLTMRTLLRIAAGAALGLSLVVGLRAAPEPNLTQTLLASIQRNAPRPAFHERRAKGDWSPITYQEWREQAERVAAWLMSHGLQPGERVAMLNHNNPRWGIVDLGVQLAGGVLVPFYPTLTGPQHNYILSDAEVRFLFVMDQVHLSPIARLPQALDGIQVVGLFTPAEWGEPSSSKMEEAGTSEPPVAWDQGVTPWAALLADEATEAQRQEMRARVAARTPDDLVTICYTSGTTSAPPEPGQTKVYPGKGVMLTHRNIASNVAAVHQAVAVLESDVFLSVLPLAHMFERTGGYYLPLSYGATIYYARSPKTFVEDIHEVRPTIFACVPLLFERLYNGAFQKASQKLIGKAIGGAKKLADYFGGNGQRLRERIVGKSLRKALGGRVRFAVSGGAALKRELADFFLQHVGVTVLEGYGLTETSPVLTCNRPETFEFGTVGVPVSGVEVRIAEDGEILARGPNVMKGYLNLPEETAKAIDAEGWFHSGDLGTWTIHGLLKITGRKKLLFKLKNGKYISPETIENRLKHELVSQSMVVGANQDYAAALIFPDLAALRTRAGMMGIEGSDEELCADQRIVAVYQSMVDEALDGLAGFEKIKKFHLMPVTLTVEAGELTPTMKLKRGVLEVKFQAAIAGLFE